MRLKYITKFFLVLLADLSLLQHAVMSILIRK